MIFSCVIEYEAYLYYKYVSLLSSSLLFLLNFAVWSKFLLKALKPTRIIKSGCCSFYSQRKAIKDVLIQRDTFSPQCTHSRIWIGDFILSRLTMGVVNICCYLVWFCLVLWHINHFRSFNTKSSLYIHIEYIWFRLFGFYGISTIVGYLMPNPLYT